MFAIEGRRIPYKASCNRGWCVPYEEDMCNKEMDMCREGLVSVVEGKFVP